MTEITKVFKKSIQKDYKMMQLFLIFINSRTNEKIG